MIHDIFVPCRIGNYYLHTKRVLSIEITPVMLQGLLLEYSGRSIRVTYVAKVFLKDLAAQAQINAIKKIVSAAGKFDEIVTTLSTPAIIFKELDLPFVGRETLKMVIPFEVENVLPFALDEAVIDFLITREDQQKKASRVLVAAVRKVDIATQLELFEKADIPLSLLTVDVFALYRLYDLAIASPVEINVTSAHVQEADTSTQKQEVTSPAPTASWQDKIYSFVLQRSAQQLPVRAESALDSFQPKRSELLVDIGFNSIKVLYIKDGMLHAVRVIPFGFSEGVDRISQELATSPHEVIHDIVSGNYSGIDISLTKEFKAIFEEISRTLLYFEKQESAYYLKPYRILVAGFYSDNALFLEHLRGYFGSIAQSVDLESALAKLKIKMASSESITAQETKLLAAGLWMHTDEESNLLQDVARKNSSQVLYLQLLAMIFSSILCLGGMWWRSSQEIQRWQTSYNSSKKQFVQMIEQGMGVDLKGEKNLKTIVEQAEETLKRERLLWFSFTKQNEASALEYLQELSIAIDRASIGLELRQMHIDFEKVTMTGSVKSFEALDVFEEELQGLKLLTLVEKPRELTWTIQLQPKDVQKGSL